MAFLSVTLTMKSPTLSRSYNFFTMPLYDKRSYKCLMLFIKYRGERLTWISSTDNNAEKIIDTQENVPARRISRRRSIKCKFALFMVVKFVVITGCRWIVETFPFEKRLKLLFSSCSVTILHRWRTATPRVIEITLQTVVCREVTKMLNVNNLNMNGCWF